MKLKISVLASFFLLCGLTSCIEDESSLGGVTIPQLEIPGSTDETMPILNFNMGDLCVITPNIDYKNGKEENLSFEWSVGTYKDGVKGPLKQVSTERVLKHNFIEGGSYYAHLKVTDGQVGVVMEYQVNINRTFEDGYVLVSNNEQGEANMVFVKIMTPEEIALGAKQVYMDHCIERMNDGVKLSKLVNAIQARCTYPMTVDRVIISDEDKCYFLNPNTFTIISDFAYANVHPGFKASCMNSDSYSPYAYDNRLKKYVHLDLPYMFAYEYSYFKDAGCENIFFANGLMEGSDWQTNKKQVDKRPKSYFVQDNGTQVLDFDAWYTSGKYKYFRSTDDLLKEQKVVSVFVGAKPVGGYAPSVNILSQSTTDEMKYCVYNISSFRELNRSKKTELQADASSAKPVIGGSIVYSSKHDRNFYAIDNAVYAISFSNTSSFPQKSQPALQFDSNEEVTYMDVNMEIINDQFVEELYVATYNKLTHKGSFYIYDTQNVRTGNQGVEPKAAHVACADKIISILRKPRI